MYVVLVLLLALPLSAAMSVDVRGVTATQALLYYAAPDEAACKIEVREVEASAPLVPDVNPALFGGADSDADRNVLPTGTARMVRVGLRKTMRGADGRWYSRALAADTRHAATVTCGSESGGVRFTTAPPQGIAPEALPSDTTAWGNFPVPDFDWNNLSRPVIDPRTGVKIYAANPGAWASSSVTSFTPNWYTGGLGWTNAANIASYSTAVATTNNTNTLSALVDIAQFNSASRIFRGGNWPYDNLLDIGVDIYGSGTDGNAANRVIELALSIDSGQNPYTEWVPITLPTSNAAAGTVPSSYPRAYFGGWGRILPRTAWPKRGFVTVNAGVVTLIKNAQGIAIGNSNWDAEAFFLHDWPIGTRVFIANSAPSCENNLCTIASVQNATTLTLVEPLTSAEAEFRSAHLAVMMRKKTMTGTVRASARAKVAVGFHHDIWSGGCSPKPVTTTVDARGNPLGRSIKGYACILPKTRQESGGLYFVGSSEPDIRLISLFRHPTPFMTPLPGHTQQDTPNWSYTFLGPTVASFDPDDASTMYTTVPTAGGSIGLFKIRYTGDWRALDIAYQSDSANPPITNELTWINMTRSQDNRDLRTQILASSSYDESKYGSLVQMGTAGVSGRHMLYIRHLGPQDSACWIFAFDSSTGNFEKAWFTADGTGLPDVKYGGCHAVMPLEGGAFLISNNGLQFGDNRLYGGPFSGPVIAVKRRGEFDTSNTAIGWPPSSAYDSACPDDIAEKFKEAGAGEDQCVTILAKEPCSAVASEAERLWSPCPWDPAQSMVAPLREGDFLKDRSTSFDSEGLQVVRKTDNGGGTVELVLLRNANYSYCALGKDGVGMLTQYIHANGWMITAASQQQCGSNNMVVDIATNSVTSANYNVTIGHFDVVPAGPGIDTWIGGGSGGVYRIMQNRKRNDVMRRSDVSVPQWPKFAGYDGGGIAVHAATVQSYVTVKQKDASEDMRRFAFDFRHYNGWVGIDFEYPRQTLGKLTSLTLQEGTTSVYKMSYSGVPDAKRGVLNVWAAENVLAEKSSAAEGDTISDADAWHFCYAYRDNECRSGSHAGEMFAVVPKADPKEVCWASQLNQRVPCAMAGPVQASQAVQLRIDEPDPDARHQRFLGSLLMSPGQQYVYSKVLPSPDASYLLFAGFLLNGYHTGLLAMKLPSWKDTDVSGSAYQPIVVKGSGSSVYVEFGYEENGSRTDFFCTARREACRVTAEEITESNPFLFAHEPLTPVSGSYKITIPVLPGHVVYYRVVENGEPGPLQVAVP
jgi:hypothetical protein